MQSRSALASAWSGGKVASAGGMRYAVRDAGAVSAFRAELKIFQCRACRHLVQPDIKAVFRPEHITVPGTLRDSLTLLAVVLEQQTDLQPTQIMTNIGAYSDVVFGLFRLLGYRFSPRLAQSG